MKISLSVLIIVIQEPFASLKVYVASKFISDTILTKILVSSSDCQECPAGNFCPQGTSDSTIQSCSAGHYCPEGSSSETPCPGGSYCGYGGESAILGICSVGNYCPEGSIIGTPCSTGSFCPAESSENTPCGAGYYCPSFNQRHGCEMGYYCPGNRETQQTPCTSGSYCPSKSTSDSDCYKGYYCPTTSQRFQCTEGNYCPTDREISETQCPAGRYCGSKGMTHNGYSCTLGSYCPAGSISDNDCGSGSYCPSTTTKKTCSSGNICPTAREISETPCPAGSYCSGTGRSSVSGDCLGGYYCSAGSTTNEQNECPVGSYCPTGSATHSLCSPGSYCPLRSIAETDCGIGSYCPTTGSKTTCPKGSICSTSRLTSPNPCTKGNYCPNTAMSSAIQCEIGFYCPTEGLIDQIPCLNGSYCESKGLTEPTGKCSIGYYCPTGSSSSQQNICDPGYYCPAGSSEPTLCECSGHGNCTHSNIKDCSCEQDYGGSQCETFFCFGILKSDDSVCSGKGFCTSIDICECQKGYFGDQCERFTCNGNSPGNGTVCSNNGECVGFDQCKCSGLNYGDNCAQSYALPIILSVSGIVGGLCLLFFIILIPIGFILFFQMIKLGKFKKYENDIKMIQLEEAEGEKKLSIGSNFFTIKAEDVVLKKSLGNGAFGEVFLAEWENTLCAVKMFRTQQFMETTTEKNDFEKELELLSSISHPNIVSFHGCMLKPPKLGIVEEYCPKNFENIIYSTQRIPFKKKLDWILQICAAVDYLHNRNIVHRDLKLENILQTKDGVCKLVDFGLSKIVEEQTMTRLAGTSITMAPEVTFGNKYDTKCDVFSLSIVFYSIITRTEPYKEIIQKFGSSGLEIKVAKNGLRPEINKNDPSLQKIRWIINLIEQCWNEEPSFRPGMKQIIQIIKKNYDKYNENDVIEVEKKKKEKRENTKKTKRQSNNINKRKKIPPPPKKRISTKRKKAPPIPKKT